MNVNNKVPGHRSHRVAAAPDSLVELGANSLKFHFLHSGYIHTVKYAYDLGHDVYRTGRISPRTLRKIVNIIRGHGVPSFAIATSAVRETENSGDLFLLLKEELDLDLHVLSCFEESSLLARAFVAASGRTPALVVDVGGGSVEIVFLSRTRRFLWDSLPIGAIRLYHRWKAGGLSAMSAWIDRHLARASIVRADEIYATGGTVKAMARALGKSSFAHRDVARLEGQVRRDGPPPGLKAARARVFLPGVILVRRLLEFVRAETVCHIGISVGRRALEERLGTVVPAVASSRRSRSAAPGS